MKPQFILILMVIAFISCDKQYAKKLAGDYNCCFQTTSWQLNSGSSDTTYNEVISITREDDKIILFGHSIQID